MYERLLVAVDHSESSARALAAAQQLASAARSEVWVLHLREREVIARLDAVPSESDTEARDTVEEGVEKLRNAGIDAHGEVRDTIFGHAAREIVADAKAHDASVIVIGTRGRGEIASLVLGSTAHKVIHLASGPVLVVP